MRGEKGSPGSPSEMSRSLPGPGAHLSLRGPRTFTWRLKSEMNLSEQFTTQSPSSTRDISLTSCKLSVNVKGFSINAKLIKCFVCFSPEIILH